MTAGCGDDTESGGGGSGNAPSTGGNPGTGGEGGTPASCELPSLDLEGTWAVKITLPADITGAPGGAFETCPATQQGDATVLLVMNVTELAPNHSARFSVCSVDLPVVTAAAPDCATGTDVDLDLLPFRDRIFDDETNPMTIAVDGDQPGTPFTVPEFRLSYGKAPPLPAWDTADVACDDPTLGHGGACEDACLDGGCQDLDYWNDDFPGFSWGLCGIAANESVGVCEFDEPEMEGATVQGPVFTTMSVSSALEGTFASSCEADGTATAELVMSIIGGNVYVAGEQANVTAIAKGLPSFAFDGAAAPARFVRIDGRHGSPDYSENDLDDTCDLLIEHAAEL